MPRRRCAILRQVDASVILERIVDRCRDGYPRAGGKRDGLADECGLAVDCDDGMLVGQIGVDVHLAECLDELVEVHGRAALLDGIGLRFGCVLRREQSLRERESGRATGLRVVVTRARDARKEVVAGRATGWP